MDWLQGILKGYTEDIGCQGIMAPHPDGHVGVFASPTEKVRLHPEKDAENSRSLRLEYTLDTG